MFIWVVIVNTTKTVGLMKKYYFLQKADKTHLDGKVNRSIFDQTTDELNKMINDILSKMLGHVSDTKNCLGNTFEVYPFCSVIVAFIFIFGVLSVHLYKVKLFKY